jgi:hypothetical protein
MVVTWPLAVTMVDVGLLSPFAKEFSLAIELGFCLDQGSIACSFDFCTFEAPLFFPTIILGTAASEAIGAF